VLVGTVEVELWRLALGRGGLCPDSFMNQSKNGENRRVPKWIE